jgi:SAM-dependent methyltransferase
MMEKKLKIQEKNHKMLIKKGLGFWRSTITDPDRVIEDFPIYRLPKISRGIILDLGCSSGLTTQEIARIYQDSSVIGIDINPEKIQEARSLNENPNINFVIADGYNMPFPDSAFNGVFCMNNLNQAIGCEVVSGEGLVRIANEIGRVIKSKGHLMFSGEDETIMQKRGSGFNMVYYHCYYKTDYLTPSQKLLGALNHRSNPGLINRLLRGKIKCQK